MCNSLFLLIALLVALSYSLDNEIKLFPGTVKRYTLLTDTQQQFSVYFSKQEIDDSEGFVFQTHSQRHAITLSSSDDLVYGKYLVGTNVGLWQYLSTDSINTYTFYVNVSCSLYCNGVPENVTILVAANAVSSNASIPGGCALTSSLDVDPNVYLNYTPYTTSVSFHDGNVGYRKSETPKICSKTYNPPYSIPTYERVSYTVYHKVLQVGDYSEGHMFDAIEEMLTASSILKKKDSLPNFGIKSVGFKKSVIDSYEGDGVVYNVIASVDGYPSTAYVPAVTYACKFTDENSKCVQSLDRVKMVVGVVTGLIGLFLLFAAHRLFTVEAYMFSSLLFAFGFYLIVGNFGIPSLDGAALLGVRVSIALVAGLVVGGLFFLLWFFGEWYLPSILLFTGSAGFLLMATAMYTISFTSIDKVSVLKINYVYGLLNGCCIVLFLIPAVIIPRVMNILSSSFIGSYLIIFCVGSFVYTSLTEVIMRVVKNATVSGYISSQASYTFEIKDIILVTTWIILFILGVIVQAVLTYKQKPFPEKSPYKWCKSKVKKRRVGVVYYDINDETRRLLTNPST